MVWLTSSFDTYSGYDLNIAMQLSRIESSRSYLLHERAEKNQESTAFETRSSIFPGGILLRSLKVTVMKTTIVTFFKGLSSGNKTMRTYTAKRY